MVSRISFSFARSEEARLDRPDLLGEFSMAREDAAELNEGSDDEEARLDRKGCVEDGRDHDGAVLAQTRSGREAAS